MLNLAASYRLTETWSLFGRIENATDTELSKSRTASCVPGIGAYGGIKVEVSDNLPLRASSPFDRLRVSSANVLMLSLSKHEDRWKR